MSIDISHLLEQWDYEPGRVVVRRFKGKDGQDKIQLRVDLGILQMNAAGRPDGKKPLGFESWFDVYVSKLNQFKNENSGSKEDFTVSQEDCAKMQLEMLQYHHRSLCLLELQDFGAACRDTERNLTVLDFVDEFAETDELAWSLQQFRPQVVMLNVRSRATQQLQANKFSSAIEAITEGVTDLRSFYEDYQRHDLLENSHEIRSLEQWLEELNSKRPLTRRERLELDLQDAVKREDYEKAAQVRDALKNLSPAE